MTRQKLRLGMAGALTAGVIVVATGGLGTPASAYTDCWYTGHGTANSACAHNKVVWEQTIINSNGHFHQYKHDVSGFIDHHPTKWISG